jgi:YVTN family beta-propeller protein
MNKVAVTLFALMGAVSASVFASGDVGAGQAKSTVCAACHGATGISPNDEWPSLAGQRHTYLVTQMKAFRAGTRMGPLMDPWAKPLTDEEIENLAAFYAAQKPPGPRTASSKADVAAGRKRADICMACHGATGMSPNDAWPNLAGQGHAYLVKQMNAFREGGRKDPLMEPMAKQLSAQEIENLIAFYSSQTATPPSAPALTSDPIAAEEAPPHAPIIASPHIFVPRPHPSRQYWAQQMPDDKGRDIIWQKCQLCHDLQRTLAFVRPRQQWQHIVESMMRRGTPLNPEEIPIIVDYFAKHFGPDSPPILAPGGAQEIGMRACKPSEWPKGTSDFRKNWQGSYNIWVSNQQGGNIDIVDTVTYKIVNRINCVSAADRIEFSRDGNIAYAPDRVEHNVTIIDTRTGAIKKKIPLIDRPNTAVLSRDFKRLYVGIWPVKGDEHERGYVQVVDTEKLEVVRNIVTKGGIHDPWMSRDGKILLAMSPEGRFMDVYDAETEKLLYTCCTEGEIGTMEMEAGPDGSTTRFFISYSRFPGVVAIDAKTGKELNRISYPDHTEGPFRGVPHSSGNSKALGFHGAEISPDGKALWVQQGSVVHKFDLPAFKHVGDVHLAPVDQAGKPWRPAIEGSWLTINPDGSKVYAVRPGRNLLSVIDAKTMKEEVMIATGEYPLHISIWPRGTP